MKPTFDSRVISRRFRIEWTARTFDRALPHRVVRVYVEARRRKDGSLYWRKVWTSGQADRYSHLGSWGQIQELLQLDGLFDVLELSAEESTAPLHLLGDSKGGPADASHN